MAAPEKAKALVRSFGKRGTDDYAFDGLRFGECGLKLREERFGHGNGGFADGDDEDAPETNRWIELAVDDEAGGRGHDEMLHGRRDVEAAECAGE
jgi:hypothetical protein